eukprot:CAMPEP_0172802798 /NCGR_PEP_ID=MMETSP1075-20121228/4094_1 /TAXON_ID=2916 /ORGANISM="Ceratium fusus, Strain PA161109" /LENGTH=225 /DNA_ID=CAMNT_0013641115 /DNA_START=68 /DNA_END=742 /DNA_ORIENTATION=+
MAGRVIATVAGSLGASVLPWILLSPAPSARSAWCWTADGKNPAGPTGGVILNSDTFVTDPKDTYYKDHMSPCCKTADDDTPTYYCFNDMECACSGVEATLVCTALMPHDDVLSTVPGRAVSCPQAQWRSVSGNVSIAAVHVAAGRPQEGNFALGANAALLLAVMISAGTTASAIAVRAKWAQQQSCQSASATGYLRLEAGGFEPHSEVAAAVAEVAAAAAAAAAA